MENYLSSELSLISESNEELYQALLGNQIDAVIDDAPIALHFSHAIDGLNYRGPLDGTDADYATMTALHNVRLREQINATLQTMESDGRLSDMRTLWFDAPKLKPCFQQTPFDR
jgi:ABC-type amino acid transport substrate-binding protein